MPVTLPTLVTAKFAFVSAKQRWNGLLGSASLLSEISVNDTGIGTPPAEQPTIFEKFRQVGGDYAHKKEGTGLGLTLAKKFVELHGGKIWVESEVGPRLNVYLHVAGQIIVSLAPRISCYKAGAPRSDSHRRVLDEV